MFRLFLLYNDNALSLSINCSSVLSPCNMPFKWRLTCCAECIQICSLPVDGPWHRVATYLRAIAPTVMWEKRTPCTLRAEWLAAHVKFPIGAGDLAFSDHVTANHGGHVGISPAQTSGTGKKLKGLAAASTKGLKATVPNYIAHAWSTLVTILRNDIRWLWIFYICIFNLLHVYS